MLRISLWRKAQRRRRRKSWVSASSKMASSWISMWRGSVIMMEPIPRGNQYASCCVVVLSFCIRGWVIRTWSKNHITLALISVSSHSVTPCPLPGAFELDFVQIFKRLPRTPNTPRCRRTIPIEQWLWLIQVLYIELCATDGGSSAQ